MLADRAYRLLLRLLPSWFREEFADEMLTVFRGERALTPGGSAVLALWARTVRGVVALAWRIHREAIAQDVVYALRTLRKTPAFTFAAVGTLALGLGPTLVIANFLYQVLVAPLPFAEPDRLVRMWNARPERQQTRVPLSTPDYMDFRARQTSFDALAAHTGTSVAMVIGDTARQLQGVLTTADLHHVLRVHTRIGRDLSEADMVPGAAAVMVLGARLWRAEFGARATAIGEAVKIDGQPTTIVGVLDDDVPDFPLGSANYWLPLTLDPANQTRGTHYLNATGRLKRDTSAAQAEDAMNSIAVGLAAAYPDTNRGKTIEVFGLKEQMNGDAPRLLTILTGAIAAVLLIACLNVASLLAVRATARRAELALRTALGATGRRLRRQLIVEHLLLAIGGGILAVMIGIALHRSLIGASALQLPRTANTFGWQAIVVLVVLVIAIGALFAVIATRRASATPAASLLTSARQTDGRRLIRLRQVLVGTEVGAALVLLITAGLMLRSAQRLSNVDPGFRTVGVLTFGVVLPGHDYMDPAKRIGFAERVVAGLRQLPGVREAAIGAYAPMGEMRATRRYAPTDRPLPATGAEPVALDLPVGPNYFRVMGIRLLDGRTFEPRDDAKAPPVIIVSEEFARRTFGSERAIGKQLRFFSSRPGGTPPAAREIVGVVADVRQDGVRELAFPQMYTPYSQNAWAFVSFFVHADGDPAALGPSVQRVVGSVDPLRPARDLLTTTQIVRGSTARHRTTTVMFLGLAAVALLLASVGLYGVSATTAAHRSRELAIRAAIGAEPRTLLRLVFGQALRTTALGIVIGTLIATVVARGLESLLFEVKPQDPATIVGTALLLLLVGGAASYLPARRTLRQNPAAVLRGD